ncbi:MAG: HK97-gp10 family putative phage morphogenesis protein [Anaerolineales bacterium]
MAGARIVIKYNHLDRIAAKLPEAVGAIVRKAAFDVEANAKAQLWQGHGVDTGKMKNSITSEFPTQTSAIIAPHTDYAIYVEFGTKRMRAIPFMRPAAEKVAPAFIEACRRLEERLR